MNDQQEYRASLWLFTLVGMLVIVAIALGFSHCENAQQRQLECVKLGHPPAECKQTFSSGGY